MSNRQMIAEIYDAMAEKTRQEFKPKLGESIMRSQDKAILRANELHARAELYRDIDALGQPIGHKTRR